MRPVVPDVGGRVRPDDAEEHRVRSQELEEVVGDLRDRWCDRLPDRLSPVLRSRWRRRRPILRMGIAFRSGLATSFARRGESSKLQLRSAGRAESASGEDAYGSYSTPDT